MNFMYCIASPCSPNVNFSFHKSYKDRGSFWDKLYTIALVKGNSVSPFQASK